MKTFKIVDGDLVLDKKMNVVMLEGIDELAQCIERTLTTNIGEWFLNIEFGLDYNAIQGKGKDKEGIQFAIREAILQDDRVDDVEFISIDVDRVNRYLTVKLNITTKDGQSIEGLEVTNIA